MEKIISFIIPSYNCQAYLEKGLSSFLNFQVLDALDIIIVNDGSSDGTAEIAQRYCRQYPQSFRLISQENKGHGGALNTGCAAAIGKYLKVIDADDWVITENLPRFVQALQTLFSDVVLTHYHTVDISNGEIKCWKSYPEAFNRTYNFGEIMANWKSFDRCLTFHGITYRTDFYKSRCISLSEHVFYEDHEFATIPCCYAKTLTPLDLFVYEYRIGDLTQSVSDANQLKRFSHTKTVLFRLVDEFNHMYLPEEDAGRDYCCQKIQALVLSCMKTALLVNPDRKAGTHSAREIMQKLKLDAPAVYARSHKKYQVFRLMHALHISKKTWETILSSGLYNTLRHNHSFH